MKKIIFALLSFIIFTTDVSATHVVGGNLYYRCLGNDMYEITLEFRRDCFNGSPNAEFDDPASIGIFDPISGERLGSYGDNGELLPNFNNEDTLNEILTTECKIIGADVCVHSTVYRDTVFLPFRNNGYQLSYQRCCRNITLLNIEDPLQSGTTYTTIINKQALQSCNTQATFDEWATIFLCANEELVFDHSGTDADGDSLAYKLCTPKLGASFNLPAPDPPDGPPYEDVVWANGYDLNNMLGGIPLEIDPVTGIMTAVPNTIGQFLVGVCIEEWRDGVLISTTSRDFEYNVRECQARPDPAFTVEPNPSCEGLELSFVNMTAVGDVTWYFEYPDLSNPIENEDNPTYVFPESGLYTVALAAVDGECRDTAFMEVGVALPDDTTVDFSLVGLDCTSDSIQLVFTDESTSTQEITAWNWVIDHDGMSTVFDVQNPTLGISNDQEIDVFLEISTISGCVYSLSETIPVTDIFLELLPSPVLICVENSTSLIMAADPNLTYTWLPLDNLDLSDPDNPIASPLETTTYMVTATNGICTVTDQVTVEVSNEQQINFLGDTSICNGVAVIEAVANVGASFEWFSDEAMTMSLGSDNPLTYNLTEDVSTLYVIIVDDVCQGMGEITLYDRSLDFDVQVGNNGLICNGDDIVVEIANNVSDHELDIAWSTNGLVSEQGENPAIYNFDNEGSVIVEYMVENQYGCSIMGNATIDVYSYPILDIKTPLILCPGEQVELNPNGNPDFNYSWSPAELLDDPNSVNPIVTELDETTTFSVTVTNNDLELCPSVAEVTVNAIEEIGLTGPETYVYCEGDTAMVSVFVVNDAVITWIDAQGEVVFIGNPLVLENLDPGVYTVMAEDQFGCSENISIEIEYSPNINLMLTTEDNFYCEGSGVTLEASSDTNTEIVWYDSDGNVIGNGTSIEVFPEGDVTYTAIATDAIECSETESISLSPYLQTLQIDSPSVLCVGEEGTATLILSDPDMEVEYVWSPEGPITSGQGTNEIDFILTETTIFSVLVTNAAGCEWIASFETELSEFATDIFASADPTEINLGDKVQLTTNDDGDYTYDWDQEQYLDFDDIYNPMAMPEEMSTTFSVTVTNADGCTDVASVAVSVNLPLCDESDVFVPNMFSPNADGLNDTWRIESNFIDEMTLIVYSRWGEEVFTSNSQDKEWDGTFNNEQLEPDVYGYHLRVRCINGFDYTTQGNVTILK